MKPHNKFCEREFGMLDHLVAKRPNASTLANESFLAFTLNKTGSWLAKQNCNLEQGRKLGVDIKSKFKERLLEIRQKALEAQKQKQKERERGKHRQN